MKDTDRILLDADSLTGETDRIDFLLEESFKIKNMNRQFFKNTIEDCLKKSYQLEYKQGIGIGLCYMGLCYYQETGES